MRKIALLFVTVVSLKANAAYLVNCKGNRAELSFSESSFIGQPLLSLDSPILRMSVQGKGRIEIKPSESGSRKVKATVIGHNQVVSGAVEFYIPTLTQQEEHFETSIRAENLWQGQQEYVVQCVAQRVEF